MLAPPASTKLMSIPPILESALNDFAILLLHHRLHVHLTGSDGRAIRISPQRRSIRAPLQAVLTATEWRLASLVAIGSTNREVAEALTISPKTVEAHLSHIYRKAGVRSRSELAFQVARFTIPSALPPTTESDGLIGG